MNTPERHVEVRGPLVYLAVAGVLALLSLLPLWHQHNYHLGTDPSLGPTGSTTPPSPNSAPCAGLAPSPNPTSPLPAPGAMPAGSTMAAIVARGRLIAGVDQGDYLSSYRDPVTGNLQGSDIDLVRLVAAALFGDPNKVQFVVLDIADRAAALQHGQVDLIADVYTVTCQRQRELAFSSSYLLVNQRLLVPAASNVHEVEDLAGQPICTSRGSTNEAVLHRLRVSVVPMAGISDCMAALQSGRVAGISSDDVVLAGMAAQDPTTRVVGRSLDTAPYAIAMRKQTVDLVEFVNGVLARARADGTLAASNRRWYANYLNPVPGPP